MLGAHCELETQRLLYVCVCVFVFCFFCQRACVQDKVSDAAWVEWAAKLVHEVNSQRSKPTADI